MENASKALIIAGAILLSIAIIGIGMSVLNSVNPVLDQTTDTAISQAAEMFNSNFTQFEGAAVKGSQIKQLYSKVNASNGTNDECQILIYGVAANAVNNQKSYKVTFEYATATGDNTVNSTTVKSKKGYICGIKIEL